MKMQFNKEKSIAYGVLAVKLCGLLIIAIAWTGCDDPPPPPPRPDNPWTPCECDAEEVVLSFGITDLSRFTVDPDRSDSEWKYRKGELVTITYDLRAADRFLYWEVDPPSHLAHWSQSLTIHVYMTDNTLVNPLVMEEGNIVYITIGNNHPAWTTVSPEPGTYPYTYGSVVSISASPNAGYKVVSWEGKKTGSTGSWGRQFTNPITVKAVGDYTFSPDIADVVTPGPTLYNASVSLTGDGTADIFCAAIPATGAFGVAPFNTSSAECDTHFDARCLPHPGFDLTYFRWTHDNGATWNYLTTLPPAWPGPEYSLSAMNEGDIPVAGWDGANFQANLTRTVSLDIEVQGQGVVTSPDFKTHWNPQLYEPGRHIGYKPSALLNSNEVEMTAEPCEGWGFHHWEIKDGNDEWQFAGNDNDLTVFMNWWNEGNLYHVPNGKSTLDMKAIFEEITVNGFNKTGGDENPGNCFPSGYVNGFLIFEYEWFSSTGNLMDLDGKVVEVICYDSSVSEEEIVSCLESDRNEILNEPVGPDVIPCSEVIVEIDQLYAYAMGDLAGTPFIPVRFYHNAKTDASTGFLTDNNELRGPCWLSCEYAQVVTSQSFFHVPVCGQIYRVGGPFEITRNSSGDNMNFSIIKHGEFLSSGCLWQECECEDFVPDCSCD